MFRQCKRICSISGDLSCSKTVWVTYWRKHAELRRLASDTLQQQRLQTYLSAPTAGSLWAPGPLCLNRSGPDHQKHQSAWFWGQCFLADALSFIQKRFSSPCLILAHTFSLGLSLQMNILQNIFILWWQSPRREGGIFRLSARISLYCVAWWGEHGIGAWDSSVTVAIYVGPCIK